jgi:hypothetical protein
MEHRPAIGSFERGLMTPGPFDEFLGGKMTALRTATPSAASSSSSSQLHQLPHRPDVGGTMYQKLGT